MPNKMSELIDYILELPNTKDFWKDDMRPSIETIGDLKLCLYELSRMCESIYPNTSIPERLNVENQMIEIAKTLYSLYSHLDLLKSVNRPYGEIEPLVNELNVNKAVLEENLKDLISA